MRAKYTKIWSTLAAFGGLTVWSFSLASVATGPGAKETPPQSAAPLSAGAEAPLFKTMNFPDRLNIANFEYSLTEKNAKGESIHRQVKVKARGKVRVPINVGIFIDLLYDGPENLQYLDQLNALTVQQLKAQGLDLDDKQMAYFKRFPLMFRINIDSTLVTDKSVPLLASFRRVNDLRISKLELTGKGFEAFSGLPLSILSIEGSSIKEGSLAKIKTLPQTLINLNADRAQIGPSDIAFLANCTHLTGLDLGGNKKITDACAQDLAKMKNLDSLNISDTLMTEQSLPLLAKLPKLKTLIVRESTFWKLGHGKSPRASLAIEDMAKKSRTPSDVWEPLH